MSAPTFAVPNTDCWTTALGHQYGQYSGSLFQCNGLDGGWRPLLMKEINSRPWGILNLGGMWIPIPLVPLNSLSESLFTCPHGEAALTWRPRLGPGSASQMGEWAGRLSIRGLQARVTLPFGLWRVITLVSFHDEFWYYVSLSHVQQNKKII
jgi:hypothetical protein